MKKHVFHLNKKALCLGAGVILTCAFVLTGCDSTKKITSSALEENEVADGSVEEAVAEDIATSYSLEVVYSRMDKEKLTVDKIEDIDSNSEAFIVDAISSVPIYQQGSNDETYVAYVDTTDEGTMIDYELYSDGDADSMSYDAEKGIVSIPKSLCEEMADGGRLGIQFMVAVEQEG